MYLLIKPQQDRDDCMVVLGVFTSVNNAKQEINSRWEDVVWSSDDNGVFSTNILRDVFVFEIHPIKEDHYIKPYWESGA